MRDDLRLARLVAKLLKKREITADECWYWTGSRFSDGYGQVSYRDRPYRVHRVAAALWLGLDGVFEKEDGFHKDAQLVLHRCDHPLCFNPDHLYVGTPAENMQDRDNRGHGIQKGSRRVFENGRWRFERPAVVEAS